ELRQHYGMAYRSSTWVDEVLPSAGRTHDDRDLTRDLLAVAALDAGGLRADVSALVAAHDEPALCDAAAKLLIALERVRDMCIQRELGIGGLPASDPPSWSGVLVR